MALCGECGAPLDPDGSCATCLLAQGLNSTDRYEPPTVATQYQQDSATHAPGAEKAGMRIGRYQLVQKIGEGGMGEVWLAEQREPVRRRVALKLVKAGFGSR